MPQIRRSSLGLATLFSLLALALPGCGDVNSQATLDTDSGKHVTGWLPSGHMAAAQVNITGCTDCHGQDLTGGIANVSCLKCHIGSATSVHPVLWGGLAYALHAGYVSTNGNTSCAVAVCHGTDLLGVAGSGPSCAINCHMAGTAQAPQFHAWVATSTAGQIAGHKNYFDQSAGRDYTTCRNNACHGGAGTSAPPPGVFASGPSCIRSGCHGSGNPLPAEN